MGWCPLHTPREDLTHHTNAGSNLGALGALGANQTMDGHKPGDIVHPDETEI